MRDLLADHERMASRGRVGRAVVTSVWGSAPRRAGACMLVGEDGQSAGSVSGGCVEASVIEAVLEAMRTGRERLLEYAVTDDRAWDVGLACGGTIRVFVEPTVRPEVLEAARHDADGTVATVIAGAAPLGVPSDEIADQIQAGLGDTPVTETRTVTVPLASGPTDILVEVFRRRPTLLLIGAVHVAQTLAELARPLGFRVVVADAREGLLTRERFPHADDLVPGWPEEVFERFPPDTSTHVCVLTHDPKFDEPAVRGALRSEAAYVGAIGSRRTQEARRARLRAEGFTEDDLARLHGPIGLDLGGRTPEEIALAILAEVIAVRHGRRGTDRSG